jgi:hypothetical protein
MSFFFPTHDSVNVEVVVGDDTANGVVLRVGSRQFQIPERLLQALSEMPGFRTASPQEQVKTILFEMVSSAN